MKIPLSRIGSLVSPELKIQNGPIKYLVLYNDLKEAILTNELNDQTTLPATRALAEYLEVSRSTVLKAYELLKLEGYLEAKVGSAHVVNAHRAEEAPIHPQKKVLNDYAQLSEAGKSFLTNTTRINSTDDKGVAFRPGVPPLDLFPVTKWKKLQNDYWRFVKASDLSYHSGAGEEALRKTLASYLNLRRNVRCNYEQIFVVGGSLQSLYLIGSLLANPGDQVFVEDPTFPNVHSIFKGLRALTAGIPLDSEGIDLNVLEAQLKHNAKLIHVTPSCQYPLGIRMTHRRKTELLHLAQRKGLYLIENDYEHEINYPDHNAESLFSMDDQDRTFYLGTFNRILHPSIRVGFVVVPKHLIAHFQALIMHSHRFVSPALQIVLRGFIEKKYFHDHVRNVTKEANYRKTLFLERLRRDLPDYLKWQPFQSPSLHLTTLLKKEEQDRDWVNKLSSSGVIAHALSNCYVDQPQMQGLILGYSSVNQQHLDQYFDRMVSALKRA